MIVRIMSKGSSFKGLATYLTHDPGENTSERVAWTHTLNLANDHVPSAVDEMVWTARNAELLKQEAGIRAGGRSTEDTVKHISLNWSPEDRPNRDHMIETAEDFLRHMKWHEHQAVLVAHDEKSHAHVHLMLNVIHPETGLRLNDDFERRRAQAWALGYEREQGKIYCDQRLMTPEERDDSMPRPAWMSFEENRKIFERDEAKLHAAHSAGPEMRDPADMLRDSEWKRLKEIQKNERVEFFQDGKFAFSQLRNSVYREVREEFRENWAEYHEARKNGADDESLAAMKAKLVAEQKSVLEERRDAACDDLRETRDELYRQILEAQSADRSGLRSRQEMGHENGLFFDLVEAKTAEREKASGFRDAAKETTVRPTDERIEEAWIDTVDHSHSSLKSPLNISSNFASALGFGTLSIFDSLADGLIASKPAPKPKPVESEYRPRGTQFDEVIDAARKRQEHEKAEADEEWRKRQRSPYGE